MKNFHHQNVMELIGICWLKEPGSLQLPVAPVLVLPYMELGDLKTYLRRCRPSTASVSVITTCGLFSHGISILIIHIHKIIC